MVALVVIAYRIDARIIARFLRDHCGRKIYIVTDCKFFPLDKSVKRIEAPDVETFSITTCSNMGIFTAIECGEKIICKTDIDCILTDEAIDHMATQTRSGRGHAYRYWCVPSGVERCTARLIPRVMGTCCMMAGDWAACGGYDGRMAGYGVDDYDITRRAAGCGIAVPTVAEPKIYHIDHDGPHNRDTINPVRRVENRILAKNRTS